ncbi:MAG: expansin-like protein [Cytophagaceae bacterium]|jgi:hypothetical protein|nr:expansin-like protein [Cytophagaceae bacterium]
MIRFVIIILFMPLLAISQVFTGVATYFDGLGTPYGACGVPERILEHPYFVALNVFNTPGNATEFTRPVNPPTSPIIGEYNNGLNCGRWVKVTIGPNCIGGANDGALGQAFCRNGGTWVNDQYSGSELYMLVTDACSDGNGWCRDSRFHLDLSRNSLPNFQKNGVPSTNMFPTSWNNREITWEYVKAPNYTGDINIWFLQHSQTFWASIMVNHLENGIHRIEQKIGSNWVSLTMNSDMGQAYLLQGQGPYVIRVYDVDNNLINGGREYIFTLPNSCNPRCEPDVTPVTYSVNNPLPVTMLMMEVKEGLLQWVCSSDQDLYGYRIEGSSNGLEWKMLDFISTKGQHTEYMQTAVPEFMYYRIQVLNAKKQKVEERILASETSRKKVILQAINTYQYDLYFFDPKTDEVRVVDYHGRSVPFQISEGADKSLLSLEGKGIRLIQVISKQDVVTIKTIIPD